jgi:curved DNA-binding protein CbpA
MVKAEKENNRRCFNRYRKRCSGYLSKETDILKVEIVDYSFDGVGVILNHFSQINKGDTVLIECEELSLHAESSVQWLSQTHSGLRMGLHKYKPVGGSLRDYRLSDIFIGLQRSLKTGILKIGSGSITKKIYIKNGYIVFASSNQAEDQLGDILLRKGKITHEVIDLSSKLVRTTGKKLGAILVELAAITPKELFRTVNNQVAQIIESCISLHRGDFEFQQGPLPSDEVITLRVSAGNLIFRAAKMPACIERAKDCLSLPGGTLLSFSKHSLDFFRDIVFDDNERRIISYIDDKVSLGEIISLSGLDESRVRRTIAALLITSLVEVVEGNTAQEDVKAEDVTHRHVPAPDLLEKIEQMERKLATLDYYTMLGVEESATDDEIRSAFHQLAKELHPDRHFCIEEPTREKLHSIFAQITNAYSVLSKPQRRKEYDCVASSGSMDTSRIDLARKRFDEGRDEYRRKAFAKAAQSFAQAAYLDQSTAAYHFHYGLTLAKLDEPKKAQEALAKAYSLDPQNDNILAELGHIYLILGFPLRAKSNFMKALHLNGFNERAKEGITKVP